MRQLLMLMALFTIHLNGVEPENYGEAAPKLRVHMTGVSPMIILEAVSRQINHQINVDVRLSRICATGTMSVEWNGTDWVKSMHELCGELRARVIADPRFEVGDKDDVFVRPEVLEMNGRQEITLRLEIRKPK